jgi:hypothetical protein
MSAHTKAKERPEVIEYALAKPDKSAVVRPMPLLHRLLDSDGVRRVLVLGLLGLVWQIYAVIADNALVLPKLSDVFVAIYTRRRASGANAKFDADAAERLRDRYRPWRGHDDGRTSPARTPLVRTGTGQRVVRLGSFRALAVCPEHTLATWR